MPMADQLSMALSGRMQGWLYALCPKNAFRHQGKDSIGRHPVPRNPLQRLGKSARVIETRCVFLPVLKLQT